MYLDDKQLDSGALGRRILADPLVASSLAAKAGVSAEAVAVGLTWQSHGLWTPSATMATAENSMRLWPSWCPQAMTISTIRIRVSTGAPAETLWRLGIYADSSGQPGALIVDAGTIDPTVAGYKSITGLSAVLPYGRIWVGFSMTGSATTGGVVYTGAPLPAPQSNPSNVGYTFVSNPSVPGALPNPAAATSGGNITYPPLFEFVRSA